MHCWNFLLVFCSWLIISSLANDGSDDLQECPGGFCVVKDLCPNGMYDETYAQTSDIIKLRTYEDNVCRDEKVCCKNGTNVRNVKKCPGGFCVLKDLCPNGMYEETYAQTSNIIRLRTGEDDACHDKQVCCKSDQIVQANMVNLNNERMMEYACGVNNPNGIGNQAEVNRNMAKYGEYPWVVVILQQETILGGGTLIHPRFVLTAAHIFKLKDKLVARFGDWDLDQEEKVLPIQDIDIQKVVDHPEYQSEGLKNDIALAQLKQDVLYDKHIRPICLPSPTDLFDGQLCIATGWGRLLSPPIEYANVLKRVELPIIPRQQCKQLFAATRLGEFFRLHKSVLCAGATKDADMCDGDGGSGLYCPTESGSYVLAGIVSWGLGCGQQNVPGAYVNVAKFVSWINSTIEGSA